MPHAFYDLLGLSRAKKEAYEAMGRFRHRICTRAGAR
jgi:hypothetical protein